jgi:hypothetical protein
MKSTFARTSGGMTCARSTAITFLSHLFARPPQFFHELQHAQMLSRALFEAQLQVSRNNVRSTSHIKSSTLSLSAAGEFITRSIA